MRTFGPARGQRVRNAQPEGGEIGEVDRLQGFQCFVAFHFGSGIGTADISAFVWMQWVIHFFRFTQFYRIARHH